MHHGCGNEVKCVCAQREAVALLYHLYAVGKGCRVKIVCQHLHRLLGADEGEGGVVLHHLANDGRVVRLHVLAYEIVGCASLQGSNEVGSPFLFLASVGGIHYGHLIVQDDPTVVTHTLRHDVLALEEVYVQIVHTDVAYVLGNFVCHIVLCLVLVLLFLGEGAYGL